MIKLLKELTFPRVAFIAAFIGLISILQLSDPDYFWHLKTGEYIVSHRALPSGDIFSHTAYGKHWVLHEWLFEILLYFTHQFFGALGIKVLIATLTFATMAIVYKLLVRISLNAHVTTLLTAICFILISLGLSPRPQLLSYLFFASYLYVLLDFKYHHSTRYLWWLPCAMFIWTNCHAGYMLGLAVFVLFFVCEYIACLINDEKSIQQKQRLKKLSLLFIFTAIAAICKPTGIIDLLYPFQTSSLELTNYISEWQSADFHLWYGRIYLIFVLLFIIAYSYRSKPADLTEVALPFALIILGFNSLRHIPLAGITIAVFIASSLNTRHTNAIKLWEKYGIHTLYRRYIGGGKQLGESEFILNWVSLSAVIIFAIFYYPKNSIKENEELAKKYPVNAVRFIQESGLTGKVFNHYNHGGYLINQLYPSHYVFMDGRSDMYGDKIFKDYYDITNVQSNWEKLLSQYQVTFVIAEHQSALTQLLILKNTFKLVYEDEKYAVLVVNNEKYAEFIQKHQAKAHNKLTSTN